MTTDARARLVAAAQTLSLTLTDAQLDQLLAYMDWLAKWNKVYNLTSLRDPAEMLSHHLIDSLTAVRPLQLHVQALPAQAGSAPLRVLDVGSGGGLPGVVLAICLPQLQVTCVDTVSKKAAFIQQVAAALRLPNLKGLHARVESIEGGFDVVASRAFASLVDFTTWSVKALKPGAVWMAMKGKHPAEELAALGAGVEVFHVEPLVVPGLDVERCLVWMRVGALAG
ncbi:MAG: 16S rRNA (guanine(527)-N(7))-methyltransferase RsmG [Burkholderiaceae bacterium]